MKWSLFSTKVKIAKGLWRGILYYCILFHGENWRCVCVWTLIMVPLYRTEDKLGEPVLLLYHVRWWGWTWVVRFDGEHLFCRAILPTRVKLFLLIINLSANKGYLEFMSPILLLKKECVCRISVTSRSPDIAYCGVYIISYFLSLRQDYLFYVYGCFAYMHLCVLHLFSSQRGRKRELDPQKLEL